MKTERTFMDNLAGTAFILLQRVLPKHLMTRIVYRLSRITLRPVKNWLITRFAAAYKASRNWVNSADPMEVAKAEQSFFPDWAVEAIAAAIAYYQRLGNWGGDIVIDPQDYETALDVFAHAKLITKRHPYNDVVIAPPETR